MLARLLLLAALLGLSVPLLAQVGHPAKGSWSGDFTSNTADKTRVRLLINAWNGELSGTVNPGRRGADMSKVELDPSSWTLTIHAPMADGELVMTGTLSNLGSWNNRKYIGTWSQGAAQGKFEFTLN
jgi:hypothetical protein